MKRMLINATHGEELRVAIVDGQRLEDLDIEHGSREQQKSNIYKGKVTRVEPSLEAVFIDYGADRHGFLPFKEVARECLDPKVRGDGGGRPNVKEGLKEGQEILVQIEKEERGNKGAALTTFISLAGRFLVLMPNNPRAGGVSRRIEGEERAELRQIMNGLEMDDGMGIIVRTAGVGRSAEELQWDLDYQAEVWQAIVDASDTRKAPFLVYQESNVIVRALRDYFRSDIGEILIDEQSIYDEARAFIDITMPQNARKLKLYEDPTPLFTRYQIEQQIESAFNREVTLPSGGAIVIDHTEALVSVDVNSARATKGADIEETATNTNLEAATELARQLRLRDLGGLLVIDFIDMMANRNQRAVETRLRDALKVDRARVQVGRISRFGLLEMSRQRLRPSLGDAFQEVCPRCSGQGAIRSIGSLSLSILRLLEDEAMKDNTSNVVGQMPVDVASFLLNEKREQLDSIEKRSGVRLLVVPNPHLETPHYEIERVRKSDADHAALTRRSYQLVEKPENPSVPENAIAAASKSEAAAVSGVVPRQPAPTPARRNQPAIEEQAPPAAEQSSVIKRVFNKLFGSSPAVAAAATTAAASEDSSAARGDSSRARNSRGNNNNGNSRNNSRTKNNRNGNRNQDSRRGKNAQREENPRESKAEDNSGRKKEKDGENQEKKQNTRSKNTRNNRNKKKNENNKAVEAETEILDLETEIKLPEGETDTTDDSTEQQQRRRRRRGGRGRRGRRKGAEDGDNTNVESDSDSEEGDNNEADSTSAQDAGEEQSSDEAPKRRSRSSRNRQPKAERGDNNENQSQAQQDSPADDKPTVKDSPAPAPAQAATPKATPAADTAASEAAPVAAKAAAEPAPAPAPAVAKPVEASVAAAPAPTAAPAPAVAKPTQESVAAAKPVEKPRVRVPVPTAAAATAEPELKKVPAPAVRPVAAELQAPLLARVPPPAAPAPKAASSDKPSGEPAPSSSE